MSIIKTSQHYALIWLHGLGADASDFASLEDVLKRKIPFSVKYIFPQAPARPVTINQGYVMPAWYDITGFGLAAREDRQGLEQTKAMLFQLIDQQIQSGIPAKNIFLGGFSQGGAAAVYTGLRYPEKLAGLIAFSAYLPFSTETKKITATPVFVTQGLKDTVVLPEWSELSFKVLPEIQVSLECHRYPELAHQVCEQEVNQLVTWMLSQPIFSNPSV